jgi:hypothetical protein
MPHIFISYKNAEPDLSYRDELIDYLSKFGYTFDNGKLWYDKQGLDLGDEWFAEIRTALDDAFAIIVVITKNSTKSAWVNFEFAYAASQGIPILGLVFGDRVNILKLPISHFQVKKWQETQKTLPEILKKYDGQFSLSRLTGLAIWRLFEPLMFLIRFLLWLYYQVHERMDDTAKEYLMEIVSLIFDEVIHIEQSMVTFWLQHSHAFTRRQKTHFTHFRTICDEITTALTYIQWGSKPEQKLGIDKLEKLLGELYTTEADPIDLTESNYLAHYFPLRDDIYFKKFPEILGLKDYHPFTPEETLEGLALSDIRNVVGRTVKKLISDRVFEKLDKTVEFVRRLDQI